MFDTLTPLEVMDEERFDRAVARLRADLLDAQYSILEQARTPVILLIAGVAGAGRGMVVNTLNEWMDPRHIRTSAFGARDEAARLRPHMWRFWQALPSRGHAAIMYDAWYIEAIRDRVDRRIKRPAFGHALHSIRRFEHMLAMDDAVVLKFWLHLDADTQRARFKALEKDAATRWRVTPEDWHEHRHHRRLCRVAEDAIRETNDPHAPWHLIDARDTGLCELAVGRIVLRALRATLAGRPPRPAPLPPPSMAVAEAPAAPVGEAAKVSSPMTKAHYQPALEALQGRLNLLLRQPAFDSRSLVLVFEDRKSVV